MTGHTKDHMLQIITDHLGYDNYNDTHVFLNQVARNLFGMSRDEVLAMVYGSVALTITDKHNIIIWDR